MLFINWLQSTVFKLYNSLVDYLNALKKLYSKLKYTPFGAERAIELYNSWRYPTSILA